VALGEGDGLGLGLGEGLGLGLGEGLGDGLGLGEGLGEELGEGVGLGAAEGEGLAPFGFTLYPWKLGLANCWTGWPSIAVVMKSCQMRAGIEPPKTSANPSTLCIGISPSWCPTHTQAASCGVYPQNQASSKFWPVPVLPATGRPGSAAAVPVPCVTTPWRAEVTMSASFCPMA
jgi:hypothetical protein